MRNGGTIQYGPTTYTCASNGGCGIEDGRVTHGTVIETTTGATPTTTTIAGTAPAAPAPTYVFAGSTIVVTWPAVPDADFYRVYYDDFFSSSCRVRGTSASFCELLADNITATTYTHTSPDDETNYYWVTACNGSGCSPLDSNNPATTAGTAAEGAAEGAAEEPAPEILGDCRDGMRLSAGEGCRYSGGGRHRAEVVLSVSRDGSICREGGPTQQFGITFGNLRICRDDGFVRDDTFESSILVERGRDGSWAFYSSAAALQTAQP